LPYLLFFLPLFLLATPVKVATYNVENLFDTVYQGSEYKAYTPSSSNWNKKMLDIKLNHVSEVICDTEADIIGLQEIENEAILKTLLERLKTVGCPYAYFAITAKKGSSIQVALLSRYPIVKRSDIIVNRHTNRVRNILEVEVIIDKNPLILFVNHWKSRAYHGLESKRILEAKALQNRISKLSSKQEYIILGDLNSEYNAYLSLEKKLDDRQGQTAFNDILKTYKNHKMIEEQEMKTLPKGFHYSLWLELGVNKRWSYKFYGTKSTPDHIVLPTNMFDGKGIDYINNSFGVLKYPYLFHKKGYIKRWQMKKQKHQGKGYSDHLPIYASFDTQPYEEDNSSAFSQIPKVAKIEFLYKVQNLTQPIILKDVFVVFKRGNHAIIKQSPKGRGIYLYHCSKSLKEGYSYDVRVESINTYHGLKEITTAYTLKEKEVSKRKAYYLSSKDLLKNSFKQNEVLVNTTGIVNNGFFYIKGFKIPIHFKKKKHTPKDGSKIKIHFAHIGFYKHLGLVLYNKSDFEVL